MMRKIFLMLASSLLLFASALFFCGGSSAGESKGDLNKKQMDKLNASIEAAYHDQDLQKAVQPFQQLIPLMQAEYGANNVAVGQTRRNFAYLLSSVGMKTESNLQADLAAKILLANGTAGLEPTAYGVLLPTKQSAEAVSEMITAGFPLSTSWMLP